MKIIAPFLAFDAVYCHPDLYCMHGGGRWTRTIGSGI